MKKEISTSVIADKDLNQVFNHLANQNNEIDYDRFKYALSKYNDELFNLYKQEFDVTCQVYFNQLLKSMAKNNNNSKTLKLNDFKQIYSCFNFLRKVVSNCILDFQGKFNPKMNTARFMTELKTSTAERESNFDTMNSERSSKSKKSTKNNVSKKTARNNNSGPDLMISGSKAPQVNSKKSEKTTKRKEYDMKVKKEREYEEEIKKKERELLKIQQELENFDKFDDEHEDINQNTTYEPMLEVITEADCHEETLEFSYCKQVPIKQTDSFSSSSEDEFDQVNQRDVEKTNKKKKAKVQDIDEIPLDVTPNNKRFDTMEINVLFEKFKNQHLEQVDQLKLEREISSQKKKLNIPSFPRADVVKKNLNSQMDEITITDNTGINEKKDKKKYKQKYDDSFNKEADNKQEIEVNIENCNANDIFKSKKELKRTFYKQSNEDINKNKNSIKIIESNNQNPFIMPKKNKRDVQVKQEQINQPLITPTTIKDTHQVILRKKTSYSYEYDKPIPSSNSSDNKSKQSSDNKQEDNNHSNALSKMTPQAKKEVCKSIYYSDLRGDRIESEEVKETEKVKDEKAFSFKNKNSNEVNNNEYRIKNESNNNQILQPRNENNINNNMNTNINQNKNTIPRPNKDRSISPSLNEKRNQLKFNKPYKKPQIDFKATKVINREVEELQVLNSQFQVKNINNNDDKDNNTDSFISAVSNVSDAPNRLSKLREAIKENKLIDQSVENKLTPRYNSLKDDNNEMSISDVKTKSDSKHEPFNTDQLEVNLTAEKDKVYEYQNSFLDSKKFNPSELSVSNNFRSSQKEIENLNNMINSLKKENEELKEMKKRNEKKTRFCLCN